MDCGTHVTDQRVGSRLGRTENTKVIDTVQRKQSRVTRLVDDASDLSKSRGGGVGRAVREGGDDTSLVDGSSGRVLSHDCGGGEKCGGENSDGHVDCSTAMDGERRGGREMSKEERG